MLQSEIPGSVGAKTGDSGASQDHGKPSLAHWEHVIVPPPILESREYLGGSGLEIRSAIEAAAKESVEHFQFGGRCGGHWFFPADRFDGLNDSFLGGMNRTARQTHDLRAVARTGYGKSRIGESSGSPFGLNRSKCPWERKRA